MEVYQRKGSPFWYFDHTSGGRRVRSSTKVRHDTAKSAAALRTSRRDAERAADALVAASLAEASRPGSSLTLQQALDRYVGSLEVVGKASAKNTATLRDKLLGLREVFAGRFSMDPGKLVHTLQPLDLEALVRARQSEGAAAQTIAHEVKMVRAAVRHAAGLGFAAPEAMTRGGVRNPWRMPRVAEKTRYLSWEEWERVFAHLSPDRPIHAKGKHGGDAVPYVLTGKRRDERQDAQDLFVALTMTGGRWAEVAALTWDRIDLKTRSARLYGTKDGEERLVPLPEQFFAVLARRHAGRGNHTLVFPSTRRAETPRVGTCRAILRAIDACGLNRPDVVARYGRATVHSLRHTFASWLLQNGADLAEVQDTLGHATMQMTRRYAHLAKRKTATKLGGILSNMGEAA